QAAAETLTVLPAAGLDQGAPVDLRRRAAGNGVDDLDRLRGLERVRPGLGVGADLVQPRWVGRVGRLDHGVPGRVRTLLGQLADAAAKARGLHEATVVDVDIDVGITTRM